MGRKPLGRKAMTSAERQRRFQKRARAKKLRRAAARIGATAKPVIAAVLAGGDLDAVPSETRENCLASAEAVLSGLLAAGLSIVRTSSLR
jgi:hypothetical protein